MHSPVCLLTAEITECAIPVEKDYWPRDKFAQFLGTSSHCPPEMRKKVMEASAGQGRTNMERKVSLPFPNYAMQPW